MAPRRCEIAARRSTQKRSSQQVVGFDDLLEVATNLRWTWQTRSRSLFAWLDPAASPSALEWPRRLLLGLGRATVEERLASDPELAALATAVVENAAHLRGQRPSYLVSGEPPQGPQLRGGLFRRRVRPHRLVAHLRRGTGAVAGEFLKSASVLGVHLVGIGLLYRETSHQWLDESGFQQESWDVLAFDRLPVELAQDAAGHPVRVRVRLPGRDVVAQVWTVLVGRNRLYLLDTDLRQNRRGDRDISARLYGGDQETRIQQELVLGIGGVRVLAALGHQPEIAHLNEGHAGFAALERIRQLMVHGGLSFAEARLAAAPGLLFTTHTPVAAGHDYFPPELANQYLAPTQHSSASSSRRSAHSAGTGPKTRVTRSVPPSSPCGSQGPATA